MNPQDLIKNKEEEIEELKKEMDKEEKRDIYSGDLVRMYSKLKLLQSQLDSLIEMNKLWLDRIDEKIKEYEKYWLDARKEGDKQAEDIFYNTYSNLKELKSEDENE